MRATSSSAVLLLVLASGCSRDEEPVAVVPPPEPPPIAPVDVPAPGPFRVAVEELREVTPPTGSSNINSIRERTQVVEQRQIAVAQSPSGPARTLDRLMFQCAEEKTFAIRIRGNRLEVFPPGLTNSYLVLTEVPSDSGVHYTAVDADFRMANDLATLQFAGERYADCVSSPAAAVWQEPPRRDVLPR